MLVALCFFFFFSSRRRHTRFKCDWSSDVCSSDLPAGNIPLAQALKNPEQHRGATVRWGGAISSVENRRDETWIEIVERPLDTDGRPLTTDKSAGRLLARVQGFLDPAIFAPKRLGTGAGTLDGNSLRNIGEHPYTYPVVRTGHVYLWPVPAKTGGPY